MERLNGQLADLGYFLDDVPLDGWAKEGVHQTLGVMDVTHIVDEFLVGHLEEHEAQLRQLLDREDPKDEQREAGR